MENEDFIMAHRNLKRIVNQRYKVSKRHIFEDYVSNIALFILSPLIIVMSPFIILANKGGST